MRRNVHRKLFEEKSQLIRSASANSSEHHAFRSIDNPNDEGAKITSINFYNDLRNKCKSYYESKVELYLIFHLYEKANGRK